MKPRLLDLFCGAGGCSMGYHMAGFEVVGVDIEPQPHYPFEFHQADALMYLVGADLSSFACFHTSPVCKGYTQSNRPNQRSVITRDSYPRLISDVRERLRGLGKPYVIENVYGAKRDLNASLLLCGTMFGLPMERHRLFEIGGTDLFVYPPAPCNHDIAHISVVGHSVWEESQTGTLRKDGRKRPDSVPLSVGREAMGISWMGIKELAQAIPPVYTEWIGRQLMAVLREQVAS